MNEDLVFFLHEPVEIDRVMVEVVRGGSETFRQYVVGANVKECLVRGVPYKPGLIEVGKMIEQRTAEEAEPLMDLVDWVLHSGADPKQPQFSRYTQ